MATTAFTGNALPVIQVNTFVFAGTWSTNDTVTVTINGKALVYTLTSGTIATFLPLLVTALAALTTAEFTEITWSSTSPNLVATAVTAGLPFTITITRTTAVSGTVDGGASSTGVATVACNGPNFLNNALNWDNGLPADGDTIIFANTSVDALYGGANSAITPAAIYWDASFTGNFGLPLYHATGSNAASYLEYRPRYMQYCNSGDSTNTKIYVGRGLGNGSRRINLDTGTGQVTILVQKTDVPNQGEVCSFYWKGTHASNSLSVLRGKVGVAYYPEEVATIVSPSFAFVDQVIGDVNVVLGMGVTITTGMNIFGGTILTESNVGTVTGTGGELTVNGTATATLLNLDGLKVFWRSSGTITNFKAGKDGGVDASENLIGATVTDGTLSSGAFLEDPFRKLTFTNPLTLNRCGIADVKINLGEHITLQRANAA